MIVRELTTVIGFEVDERSEKRTQSAFDSLKKAGVALAALFAGGQVIGAFREMIALASDAGEVTSQLDATFQGAADSVREFSNVSTEVGRSRFALQKYAAQIGALIKPQLGSADAAAKMSTSVAGLAVDLGSFFNATDEDALTALRAGLIGSTEPLQRFGVDLRQSNIEQDKLALGFRRSFKDLTSAQQIQVRYNAILRQTADAQGDAARTLGSVSNQTKALDAAWTDLKTTLGVELQPLTKRFLEGMRDLISLVQGPGVSAFRTFARILNGLTRPMSLIIIGLASVAVALNKVGLAAIITGAKFLLPFLPAIVLFGLIGAAVLAIIDDLEAMGEGSESVIGGLIGEFQFLLESTGSVFSAIGGVIKTAVVFWSDLLLGVFGTSLKEIGETVDRVLDSIKAAFAFAGRLTGNLLVHGQLTAREIRRDPAGGGTTNNSAGASITQNFNAPIGAGGGEIASTIGGAAQKGTERGLRTTLGQMQLAERKF